MSAPIPIGPATKSSGEPGGTNSVFHNAYSSLLRPTTAMVMKMLNKLIVTTPSRAGTDKTFTARDIQKLIDKFLRKQRKSRDAHQALLKALLSWLGDLPSEATAAVINDLVQLMEGVSIVYATHSERLNALKVQLGSVATREARQHMLLKRHDELQRNHDTAAVKHGPQSRQAALVIDEIEENEYNLKLIEQQLARTANAGLREVSLDYIAWFQSSLYMLGKLSNVLANTLRDTEMTSSGVPRSLVMDSGRTFCDGNAESEKLATTTLPDLGPSIHLNYDPKGPDTESGSIHKHDSAGAFHKVSGKNRRESRSSNHDSKLSESYTRHKMWFEDDCEGLGKTPEGW